VCVVLRSLCRSLSFAPLGLALISIHAHGLRRGLHSYSASRLGYYLPPLRGSFFSGFGRSKPHASL
jgi:hypothetical protein